jgi:2-oxoglutarate ferredoxin oxidoreductase subunit alpha
MTEDAEYILVAYGTVARVCRSAVDILRERGIKAGLFRPVTLFPYPTNRLYQIADKEELKYFLSVELSMGQMVEDLKLAVNGKKKVKFFGKVGGNVMSPEEIVDNLVSKIEEN